MSALIQNFDTVEKVIETSANSAGSALKENERYLDSIQGRVDQFNNAMQAMWSNTLDSDVVKGFVSLGTEIIKIIDKIGLLNAALLAFGAFKGFGAIFGIFKDAGISIDFFGKKLGSYLFGINAVTAAETTLTQAQVAQKLAQQGLTAEQAQAIAAQTGLETSTANLSRETLMASLQAQGYGAAEAEAIATKIFGTTVTEASTGALLKETIQRKLAGSGLIQYAIQMKLATAEEVANMTITQLLGLGFKGLAVAIGTATKAIVTFLFTNPVGWAILAATAVIAAVAAWNKWGNTTENLKEKLDGLKSELSDIRSELDSVNSELETTQERMAELLAMDKLTFEEQEELDRLRATNDELERRKGFLEAKEETTARNVGRKAAEIVNKTRKETLDDGWRFSMYSAEEDILRKIDKYKETKSKVDNAGTLKEQEKYQKKLDKQEETIDEYITGLSEALDGVEYGDSEESDEALDYLAELQDTYSIARGSASAKTNAIKGLFDKDEFSSTKTAIDQYVKALEKGDQGAADSIADIVKNNENLVRDLEARGLEAQDAIDYFTEIGDNARFDTIKGKTKEIERAKAAMNDLMDGFKSGSINVDTLFDEDGKIIQTKLSEMFKGTSEKTRAELTKLLEGAYARIADGLNDGEMESLIGRFGIKMEMALLEVKNNALAEQNIELFSNLKDEIDGIIDSFDEMVSALNGVVDAMDLLEQARDEEAYSGSISLETMAKLMEQTDDYSKILSVDEYGAIKLVAGAEDVLIDQRIEKIKTDAQAALTVAEKTHQEALAAEQDALNAKQTLELSGPSQKWYTGIMGKLAGAIAYVGSLWESVTSGKWGGMFDRASAAYNKASESYRYSKDDPEYQTKLAEANAAYDAAVTNRENSDKELKIAQDNENIASKITKDNIKASVKSDYADGTADDKREEEENAWEKLVNKYENKLALIINERDLIQAEIDRAEANGGQASKEMYNDLIRSQLEEKKLLEDKKAALEAYLEEHKDSIDPETWTEYNNEINETAVAIKEATTNIYEFAKALRDIDMHYFEQAIDEISRLADEIDFIMSLFEDEDMSDEAGNWTEAGITKINLMRDQMTAYASLAKMWGDRLTELQGMQKGANGLYAFDEDTKKAIAADFQSMFDSGKIDKATYDEYMQQLNDAWSAGGFSEEIYNEWVNEAEDGMRDAISAQKDIRDEMLDMWDEYIDKIEEGIEKEIEAYEDLIDVQKEELDAARELHDFRKQIANDSKGISELERRIASLSGSTAASDVAERRKLQAQLRDKQSELDDRYYDHAHDVRSNALDDEVDAFTEVKNRYVEMMRETSKDTEWVINEMITNGIFNADVANDFLLRIQDTYNIPLSKELTGPWAAAADRAEEFKNAVGIIAGEGIPPYVTMISDDIRNKLATDDANNPWNQAIAMADKYADFLTDNEFSLDNKDMTTFEGQINSIISKWNSVKTAADAAYSAQSRSYDVGGNPDVGNEPPDNGPIGGDPGGGDPNGGGKGETAAQKLANARKAAQDYVNKKGFSEGDKARWGQDKNFLPLLQALHDAGGSINDLKGKVYKQPKKTGKISGYSVSGLNTFSWGADDFSITIDGKKYNVKRGNTPASGDHAVQLRSLYGKNPSGEQLAMIDGTLYVSFKKAWYALKNAEDKAKVTNAFYNKLNGYAKGTTGTDRDEWAITDEPKFGDELVLVPGKDGNLSFMRKGTGVVPADMTQKLFELAQIPTSDLMNKNLTAIVPNITKNDFKNEFNFESLVHVDTVDSDTLPKLEKMVDKKIDDFSKALNYSLKRFAR